MNTVEHLEWCKQRALVYVNRGELNEAFASFASDMSKHPGTSGHVGLSLGMELLINGHLAEPWKMEEFINGFR